MRQFNQFFKGFEEKYERSIKERAWISYLLTLLIMGLYFFFTLPSLSPQSPGLYSFLILTILIFTGLRLLFGPKLGAKALKRTITIITLLLILPIIFSIISSPILRARSYSQLIGVETGIFEDEIEKISISQVPIVDRETAAIIGEKQLGSLTDLVSQFEIDGQYSQITLNEKPIRVSPLRYFDLIKYITNRSDGIQYYVSVDMTSQEGKVVKLEESIYYSASDYLMRNIYRKVRFQYPFAILGETNFEIDETGKAYYVTPIISKTIGVFGGSDVKSAIITDAHTGKSSRYKIEDLPTWVDRAYPTELIINQLDQRGLYSGGFINSVFGQRNVTSTTEGYNYISIGDDIYLITGVTSVRSDESNLGFYYVNLRTKEARFYPLASATEYAAMYSAQGKVQEKEYTPTFPVILNIQDRPVYFMSLKDRAKTAKMYALVDAQQFTNVLVGESVPELFRAYIKNHPSKSGDESLLEEVTIKDIQEAILEGNSVYFFTVLENEKIYYTTAENLQSQVLKLRIGEKIKIQSYEDDNLSIVEFME